LKYFAEYDVIAIDEAHLLTIDSCGDDEMLKYFVSFLLKDLKKAVIITTVDRWFCGKPIKMIQNTLDEIKPDKLKMLHTACKVCGGRKAIYTMKIENEKNIAKNMAKEHICHSEEEHIEVAALSRYKPVCRECFELSEVESD
jgi:thymidine kinase